MVQGTFYSLSQSIETKPGAFDKLALWGSFIFLVEIISH